MSSEKTEDSKYLGVAAMKVEGEKQVFDYGYDYTSWLAEAERNRTWRNLVLAALKRHGDNWYDIVSVNIKEEYLDSPNFGGENHGCATPFAIFTKDRVYFPVMYDGQQSVHCAPLRDDVPLPGVYGSYNEDDYGNR